MSAATPTRTVTHLAYIDALRGFAFLGVLMIHTADPCQGMRGMVVAAAGAYGVQLFFLLSAITRFRSLGIRARKEAHATRDFYLRRFFRIAPLFWFGVVLYTLLPGETPALYIPHGVHLWQYLTTLTFMHGWAPTSINSIVPGGWSIAAEMTFYLLLPLIYRFVSGFWAAFGWGLATLAAGALLNRATSHFSRSC